jgi:hypothetical protein
MLRGPAGTPLIPPCVMVGLMWGWLGRRRTGVYAYQVLGLEFGVAACAVILVSYVECLVSEDGFPPDAFGGVEVWSTNPNTYQGRCCGRAYSSVEGCAVVEVKYLEGYGDEPVVGMNVPVLVDLTPSLVAG